MFCDRDICIPALSLQGSKGSMLSFLVLLFFSPYGDTSQNMFLDINKF